jgi:hypothetical protein
LEWNWSELKSEYISTDISYKKLCAKHDVPFHKLRKVAEREKWADLKAQARHKESMKIVEKVAKQGADHTLKLYSVADKLLQKIENTLDEMDVLDSQSIKHFTSALKDIKDIKGIKSDLDLKEQEARIEKLRKDAMTEEEDSEIVVTMEGGIGKYGA